jgi:hypothetical protein
MGRESHYLWLGGADAQEAFTPGSRQLFHFHQEPYWLNSIRAMEKHIVETEATIVEVDGQKWAIVLIAFDYGSPEAKTLVSDEIWRLLGKHDNLLTAMWRSDGKLGVVASPELEEKIRAKILPGHKWIKVRVYPPAERETI